MIRIKDKQELGTHIITQGGTFLNDSVLRAFEQELGHPVIRPARSGLMGAYGAALLRLRKSLRKSTLMNARELERFKHQVQAITCQGCTNHCRLTINTFENGERYIAGNQCEKPLGTSKPKRRSRSIRLKRASFQVCVVWRWKRAYWIDAWLEYVWASSVLVYVIQGIRLWHRDLAAFKQSDLS